jgi:uncharacterized membrane protein YhaH (DUF805 family)
MKIKDEIFMKNFMKFSKTAPRLQKFFIVWTYLLYFAIVTLLVSGVICSLTSLSFYTFFRYYTLIKGVAVELPAIIVVISNKRRLKRPPYSEWKFLREYKKY